MKAIISFILLTILFNINDVFSQESFSTSNGLIVFSATIDNQIVLYVSDELQVSLNYQTAHFEFELEKTDIMSDSEFLLLHFKPDILSFKGELGIDYIRTESHPVQNFSVEGTLKTSSNNQFNIYGQGTLSHLYYKNGISCLLNISFHLVRDNVVGSLLSSSPEAVHIEIIQTILDNQAH